MFETVSGPGVAIGDKQAIFTTETERGTQSATEKQSRIRRSDGPERPYHTAWIARHNSAAREALFFTFSVALCGPLWTSFCLCGKNRFL